MSKEPLLPIFKRVIRLTDPFKRKFWLVSIIGLLIAPIAVLRPTLVKIMVDDYILPKQIDTLWIIAGATIGAILLEAFLSYWFNYESKWLGQAIIRRLRLDIFQHLLRMHLSFFNRTPIGTLTTRTINDVETINNIFSQGLITIISDLLTMLFVIGMMLWTSWKLTLVVLTVFPLLILSTYIFKEKVRASYELVRSQISKMNAFLQERISGIHTIKIFRKEQEEQAKFKVINHAYTQANLNSIFYYAVFFPVIELISAISAGLMIWYGAGGVLKGEVTIGTLIAFPLYISMLYRPVRMLADKFNTLQMGLIVARRIFKILDTQEHIDNHGTIIPKQLTGDIQLKNLSFSYTPGHPILKEINLTIPYGKTTALVGTTGSGKTTLAGLINRSYDVRQGNILIGSHSIKEYDLQALRKRIGVVLQDVFLFRGSVMENILMSNTSISEETVRLAAKDIGAHDFFEKLPNGYNFEVMERGTNLSAGQRQLISFVRALITNPDILILDEATSSIDPNTEAIIQKAITKITEKRTSIVIAHRLGTIQKADQIIVLDQGHIIEIGTHKDLLAREN
ncbi:MAG TPA: ABC transporter ATP-binding protein, partial [Saprospiraceae bacterium]|nr:ABC transporter ATP-binding protein [Saprospiraceae bacterium]